MIETIQDAKSALEAQGVVVSINDPGSLLIGGAVVDVGEGMTVFRDASALNARGEEWVAVFPAEGLLTYEVPGPLSETVALIAEVYGHHRRCGGEFKTAFRSLRHDADDFLVGHHAVSAATGDE